MVNRGMKTVTLKKLKDKLAKNKNPWIFSGAIHSADKGIINGETVQVVDSEKRFIAYGFYSEFSAITLRLFSWNEEETFGTELIRKRLI